MYFVAFRSFSDSCVWSLSLGLSFEPQTASQICLAFILINSFFSHFCTTAGEETLVKLWFVASTYMSVNLFPCKSGRNCINFCAFLLCKQTSSHTFWWFRRTTQSKNTFGNEKFIFIHTLTLNIECKRRIVMASENLILIGQSVTTL